MRVYYPGQNAIPVAVLVSAFVLILSRFAFPEASSLAALWPIAFIAAGVEELYLWSRSGSNNSGSIKSWSNKPWPNGSRS